MKNVAKGQIGIDSLDDKDKVAPEAGLLSR
jgi:hypothetical protein